jgi:rod shape-determining protein MreC
MHYQRSKTRKQRVLQILTVGPLVLAVLLFLGTVNMPEGATGVARTLASPFWSLSDTLRGYVSGAWGVVDRRAALVAENEALREELWMLERENYVASSLVRDNEALRELVGRIEEQPSLIAVAIQNDANAVLYDSFSIDRGEEDGVREGMITISPEGVALGTVAHTEAHSARVSRFTAPGTVHSAVVQATSSVHIELAGIGAGTLRASVPRDLEIREGDTVVLPQFSSYPIGTVVAIEVTPEDAFQTLFVRSPVNTLELRYGLLDPIAASPATHVVPIETPETVTEDEPKGEEEDTTTP